MTQEDFKLSVKNLAYSTRSISILQDINIEVQPHQGLVLMGESGRGKSSLIKLLAGLEKPTSGEVSFGSVELSRLNAKKRAHFRRRNMGIAFQSPHIIPSLTVRQNVALALQIHTPDKFMKAEQIDAMLELFEIDSRASAYVQTLSGGEARRVALARAFVGEPRIVLLDEPLAGLDSDMAGRMVQKISELRERTQALLVVATHDEKANVLGHVRLDMDLNLVTVDESAKAWVETSEPTETLAKPSQSKTKRKSTSEVKRRTKTSDAKKPPSEKKPASKKANKAKAPIAKATAASAGRKLAAKTSKRALGQQGSSKKPSTSKRLFPTKADRVTSQAKQQNARSHK